MDENNWLCGFTIVVNSCTQAISILSNCCFFAYKRKLYQCTVLSNDAFFFLFVCHLSFFPEVQLLIYLLRCFKVYFLTNSHRSFSLGRFSLFHPIESVLFFQWFYVKFILHHFFMLVTQFVIFPVLQNLF